MLSATLFSCKDVDPNVRREEGTSRAVETKPAETVKQPAQTAEVKNVCVGGGRDNPQTVDGVTVDVAKLALRSYELCFLFAQKSFDDYSKINVDAAVQYAFCLLFYDELWQMPSSGDVYRSASVDEIEGKLKELFGKNDINVKKSYLYSSALDKFEMFQPNYGRSVYYNVDSAEVSGDDGEFRIFTTFYTDVSKSNIFGRTVLTVGFADGAAFIKSMTSEY